MEFYNNEDEKINLFELGKTNGVPNSQNEFGVIDLGEYDCNNITYSGLYRIYGDGQKNTPYNNGWIIRVETFKETHITQYATVTGSLETYKRKLYDGKWTNWLLVEGECKLWEGTLIKDQSVIIDRLNQFKRFKIHVQNIGYMYMNAESDNETYSGIRYMYSSTSGYSYLATGIIYVYSTSIKNVKCIRRRLDLIQNIEMADLQITRIIGIP